MKFNYKHICVLVVVFYHTLCFVAVQAQSTAVNKHRITTGPKGAVILLQGLGQEKQGKMPASFPGKGEVIEVYRSAGSSSAFKKLASVTFPASGKDLQQRLNAETLQALMNRLKVNAADAAYAALLRSSTDTLGFLAFSLPVLEAMGMAYTDKTWKEGDAVVYRFDKISNGTKQENVYSESVNGSPAVYASTYKLHRFSTGDSSVSGIWSTTTPGLPLFAQVYERRGDGGQFVALPNVSVAYTMQGAVYVQFNKPVNPGELNAYYVRPLDWAGNLGPASDTLHALSVNINKIASISDLKVTDTLEGLLLQWKPLPRQAIYSGIQVMKSRRTGSDYVILDTIPATDNAYLDRQLLPHVNYYYKVRPLLYKLPGKEQLPAAEAMGYKTNRNNIAPPQAPLGVEAKLASTGIKISWDPIASTDIFAYYVLRGTSLKTLEVISSPVKDTVYVDSLFSANDAGQLVYAVQAMSLNQSMSDTSEAVSILVRQPVVLPAPGGLQARRGQDGNYLQWDHSPIGENGVEGYMVYRRKAGATYFTLLTAERSATPFYTDNIQDAEAYEYAVTSIDAWGNQSILSPTAIVATDNTVGLTPPAQLNLRNLTAGIEISWPVAYDAGDIQYVIYKKRVDEPAFKKLTTVKAVAAYTDKLVQKGVLYEYVIALANQSAEGSRTNAFSIRR